MSTKIFADQNIRVPCARCGSPVTVHPSTTTFGLWHGTGGCGERVEAVGIRTEASQSRDGIRVYQHGGCHAAVIETVERLPDSPR